MKMIIKSQITEKITKRKIEQNSQMLSSLIIRYYMVVGMNCIENVFGLIPEYELD